MSGGVPLLPQYVFMAWAMTDAHFLPLPMSLFFCQQMRVFHYFGTFRVTCRQLWGKWYKTFRKPKNWSLIIFLLPYKCPSSSLSLSSLPSSRNASYVISIASSKARSPESAIWCFLCQFGSLRSYSSSFGRPFRIPFPVSIEMFILVVMGTCTRWQWFAGNNSRV